MLPARSPYAAAWKKALLLLPDTTRCLISRPAGGVQYVFADGTATAATSPAKIAAWGSLSATSGEVVAMGHVLGLSQSSDRAELLVALSAFAERFKVCGQWPLLHSSIWGDRRVVQPGPLGEDPSVAATTWTV